MQAKMAWGMLLCLCCCLPIGSQQSPDADELSSVRKSLSELAKRSADPRLFSWKGEVTITGQQSGGPITTIGHAKVELAIGGNGKSLLKVRPDMDEEYWLISDGKKRWSCLPGKRQYSEEDAASLTQDEDDDDAEEPGADAPPLERYAWQAVPKIAKLIDGAKTMNLAKPVTLKLAEGKVTWPAIAIREKPEEDGSSTFAELVLSPERPVAGRLTWVSVRKTSEGKLTWQVSVQFNQFSVGDPVPDEVFTFEPPKKAKLVEDLVIPGQPGAALLNHELPDFRARTIDGERVSLSDFRGKVILLDFWATWCPPCRAELPTIAKLFAEYQCKGVVVLGVNDEERGVAKDYLQKAGLTLPTLDDSSGAAHKLYHVSAIPTVFVIGADGKLLKYFRGGRSEEALRAALQSAAAHQ